MTDWRTKNGNRKDGKSNGSAGERREARRLRRMLGGAFGKETASFQRQCLPGTIGEVSAKAKTEKSEKGDK